MDLSRVIIGPIVTEKAERLKAGDASKGKNVKHIHTLRVAPWATKIDIKTSLKTFFDVDVEQVRIIKTQPKTRDLGGGRMMEKRHAFKKALVTLAPKSKTLDISAFQTIDS